MHETDMNQNPGHTSVYTKGQCQFQLQVWQWGTEAALSMGEVTAYSLSKEVWVRKHGLGEAPLIGSVSVRLQ